MPPIQSRSVPLVGLGVVHTNASCMTYDSLTFVRSALPAGQWPCHFSLNWTEFLQVAQTESGALLVRFGSLLPPSGMSEGCGLVPPALKYSVTPALKEGGAPLKLLIWDPEPCCCDIIVLSLTVVCVEDLSHQQQEPFLCQASQIKPRLPNKRYPQLLFQVALLPAQLSDRPKKPAARNTAKPLVRHNIDR